MSNGGRKPRIPPGKWLRQQPPWSHSVEKQSENSQKQSYVLQSYQLDSLFWVTARVKLSTLHHKVKNHRWWRGNTVILRGVQAGKKTKKTHIQRLFCRIISEPHRSLCSSSSLSLSLSLSFLSFSLLLFFTFPREALSLPFFWSSTLRFLLLILLSGRASSRSCSPLCLAFCFFLFLFPF